jgi:hypothetical protein
MVDRKIIVFSLNADDGGQSPGSQGSYLCAGTNFRYGCLFRTSMLINGRLGRQLSLVLSGIAKGREAGFLLVVTRSAKIKMMAD